jgi:hypothetical protein
MNIFYILEFLDILPRIELALKTIDIGSKKDIKNTKIVNKDFNNIKNETYLDQEKIQNYPPISC